MPIPKSLHTVRVLTVMARTLRNDPALKAATNETLVDIAGAELGYGSSEPDDYGLKAKAVAQLDAGQ
jgi:hypothetical protein